MSVGGGEGGGCDLVMSVQYSSEVHFVTGLKHFWDPFLSHSNLFLITGISKVVVCAVLSVGQCI